MNYRISPILTLLSLAVCLQAQVQIFTDDFNDNTKDGSKWGADFNFAGTGGTFSETSQRLEFSQSSASTVNHVRPWIGSSPTYSQDWEMIVDVHNENVYTTGINAGSSITLVVQNPLNQSQVVSVELYAQNFTNPFANSSKGFYTAMIANGNDVGTASTGNLDASHGSVRLTFDSTAKVIRAYYRIGGNWILHGSYGIAGSGGATANDSWGMSSSTPFGLAVVGSVYEGALTVASGTVYADDFQLALNTQDSAQSNPTAASRVHEGRAALAAKDLASARTKFEQALALDSNHEDANALMAIVRLLDLPNQPAVQAFLTRLGVESMGRDIYAWSASPAREPDGDLTIPTGLNGMEFMQHWRTNAVPEISAALANLAKVTSQNFLLSLTASETTFEAVDVDLGDILMIRAGLHAFEYFSYTFLAHDFNAQVAAVETFAQSSPFDVAQFLIDYPQLLTFATTNDLAAGRTAFANAADRYAEGSQFLRNRASGIMRLFNFVKDGRNSADEQKFREVFADLKTSLDGNVAVRHADGVYTLFAGALFTGNGPLRSFLPQFQRDRTILGTLPDPTFGGFLIGRTADEVETFLFAEDDLELSGLPTVPRISSVNPTGGSPISFTAKTKIGEGYIVQGSDNLTSWTNLGAFIALDLNTTFTESQTGLSHRFYRLQDVGNNLPPPANDNFANRINLGTGTANTSGYNQNAFSEGGEPNFGFSRAFKTVWYEWTPASSGNYRIKVTARDFPHPIFAVCTGSGLGSLSVLVNGFSSSTGQVFSATAGQTYFIVVDGQFGFGFPSFISGGFRLSINPE